MAKIGRTLNNITKISQVTPEVTLFLRNLGFSNYYIIKIFDLVGEAAIALTEENPYWLLDEFSHMGFKKIDEAAFKLGIERESEYRVESGISFCMGYYVGQGNTFVPAEELCQQVAMSLEVPRELVRDVLEDMAFEGKVQLANIEGRAVVYFYGYYRAECRVCGKLAELAEGAKDQLKPIAANIDALIRKAEADSGIELSGEQQETIKQALEKGVSIITGGPGTGKTTIINTLLTIMTENGLKVAVAAPTGRAAKRIQETTKRYASTVHRLLEYYYDEGARKMAFGKNQEEPLDYNAVIIDEASMMDLLLMGALCDAMTPGMRLILVGDSDQLPSVGAGNVLRDLIESEYFFTAKLTEIFRQAQESAIVVNAHRINQGDYPLPGDDFILIEGDKQEEILEKITKLAGKFPLNQVQVLTPTKKGILGSGNLNIHLQKVFNPQREGAAEIKLGQRTYRVGDRVMQIKNNYQLSFRRLEGKPGKGVFNGEMGTIAAIDMEMALVTVNYDDEKWVEYHYTELDEIEPAYAVTVHKSQGSEFPVIIMPMTWFAPGLATRNLLYTAVTRGRQAVYIVGRQDYLHRMVDNDDSHRRNSGLCARIVDMYQQMGI